MEFKFGETRLDEVQVRELAIGVQLRIDQLKKVRKSTEDAGLPVDHIDDQLAVCRGDDTSKGLLALMGEQTTHVGDDRQKDIEDPVDETVAEVEAEFNALVEALGGKDVYDALSVVLDATLTLAPGVANSLDLLDLLGESWKSGHAIEIEALSEDGAPDGEKVIAKVSGGKNPTFVLEMGGEVVSLVVNGILLTRAARHILGIGEIEPVGQEEEVAEADEDEAAFEPAPV